MMPDPPRLRLAALADASSTRSTRTGSRDMLERFSIAVEQLGADDRRHRADAVR